MRTLVIGDIHGCIAALDAVTQAAAITDDDFLVFLGDYIDRGPDSRAVVSRVIQHSREQGTIVLRGNHEAMILSARDDPFQAKLWCSYGGDEALHSYGAEFRNDWQGYIPVEHWRFFEDTKPWFETEAHIFVHATVLPDLDMCDQPEYVLYWEQYDPLLSHKSGKLVVCGHTPQNSGWPTEGKRSVCIDTGLGSGKWLTCLDVDSGNFWQANGRRTVRTGQLSSLR
ncbi:MAG TPA: metallophosphoesterase family protein [Chthoniobacteraceae bacterium]|jgi:serine/threonine protein phosphatase 1|nr:metallophosphoesterase family protein [Chthoniobacteraceae bacterium]